MAHRMTWERCSNRELLDWRLCDLSLQIEGSALEHPIKRLQAELAGRKLRLRPHCWLGEEWFSPDGVPGIALPFYLAHPRLKQLERQQCGEVEGGTQTECLQLLRHEAGHAIQHAFQLQRRKKWRETFGSAAQPYPNQYRPYPASRKFVLHLPYWYAQSHPEEDFAETFAVWLTPGLDWRGRFKGWPALRKLVYVDDLMQDLAGRAAPIKSLARPEPVHRLRITLGEHYAIKRQRYKVVASRKYDDDLHQLFPHSAGDCSATTFLRHNRVSILDYASETTGRSRLILEAVLEVMAMRCKELGLRASKSSRNSARDFAALWSAQSPRFIDRKLDWHAL